MSAQTRAAPAASGSEKIAIDGLTVELSGPASGMPVLFGHSLLLNRGMFAAQVAELSRTAPGFRCINIDFRGHGESARPPRGFTMTDQAEDYRKVLDHLGLERAAIVGLSMGAMAAMHFAVAHPGRTLGLVLLNTSAEREPATARAKNLALAVTARLFGLRPFILKQIAPLMFGTSFRAASPEVVNAWLDSMARLDRVGLYRAVYMVLSRGALGARLAELRVPTLVITGDEDVATVPQLGQRIAETVPGAELRLLPRTGHCSTVEQPELTSKLIRTWLERIAAPAASVHTDEK